MENKNNLEVGKKYKLLCNMLGVRSYHELYFWGMVGKKYNFGISQEIGQGFNFVWSKSTFRISNK